MSAGILEAETEVSTRREGEEIKAEVVLIELTIRRPSGTIMTDKNKVAAVAQTEGGDEVRVETGSKRTKQKMTRPQWRYDFHHLWSKIDAQERRARDIVKFYGVGDVIDGNYLVSMFKVAELGRKLDEQRIERLALAEELRNVWTTEAIPQLQKEYGDLYFQIEKKLPDPTTFKETFTMEWQPRRVAPMDPDNVDMSSLPAEEVEKLRKNIIDMAERRSKEQVELIIDGMFEDALEIADEIVDQDSLSTGSKTQASINRITTALDRVLNFPQFADDAVLERIRNAKSRLDGLKPTRLNASKQLQSALKSDFEDLRHAILDLKTEQTTRSRRRVTFD